MIDNYSEGETMSLKKGAGDEGKTVIVLGLDRKRESLEKTDFSTEPKVATMVTTENLKSSNWKMHLIEKDVADLFERRGVKSDRQFADEYFNKWRALKQMGLPTLPSMRVVSRTNVAMTDLTYDGGGVFGKKTIYGGVRGINGKMIARLLEIPLEEIKEEAQKLVKKATENRVALPYDDPFELWIKADGSWQLIILDLTYVQPNCNDSDLMKINTESANWVLEGIEEMREKILVV